MSSLRRIGGLLFVPAAFTLLATPAFALPPGGASADTPGTSSSVSPTTLAPCETIYWEVNGFPAGQIVNVKIDDGAGYDQSVQYTGVLDQVKADSNGHASGAVTLPCDIAPGGHWLRYLATEPINGSATETQGYSNRGDSNFTVVVGGAEANTGNQDSAAAGNDSNNGAVEAQSNGAQANTVQGQSNQNNASQGGQSQTENTQSGGQGQSAQRQNNQGQTAQGQNSSGQSGQGGQAQTANGKNSQGQAAGSNSAKVDGSRAGNQGDAVQNTALSQQRSVPVLGLIIGGAIVIVGLAGVGVYAMSLRKKD